MATKIISRIIYDENTGIPFLEDIQGNLHMAGNWSQALPLPPIRYYIQTISRLRFPNTREFHSIPNKLTGESTTEYTVPEGKIWCPAFIMASQDLLTKAQDRGRKMSIIGVYINDNFVMAIPFKNDLHYILYEPLRFIAGTRLEMKLMPCSRKTRICVLIGGELRKISD